LSQMILGRTVRRFDIDLGDLYGRSK